MRNPKLTATIYRHPTLISKEGGHPTSQENRNQASTTDPEKKEGEQPLIIVRHSKQGPKTPRATKAQHWSSTIGASLGWAIGYIPSPAPSLSLNVAPTHHAGPDPREATVGGKVPPGIAPPLALDPVLAKLTYLVADVNPSGEGFMLFMSHPGVQVMHPKVGHAGGAQREGLGR